MSNKFIGSIYNSKTNGFSMRRKLNKTKTVAARLNITHAGYKFVYIVFMTGKYRSSKTIIIYRMSYENFFMFNLKYQPFLFITLKVKRFYLINYWFKNTN